MSALFTAFRQTLRSAKLVWLLYGITLLLGSVAALPFYKTFIAEDQDSLAFLNLMNGFDYTVFSDFMYRSRRVLAPLVSVGRWLGFLYVILSVFFSGGILVRFMQPTPLQSADSLTVGRFWESCSQYVGRFILLVGVTLLFVIIGGGVWLVIGSLAGVALSASLTEQGQFWLGITFFVLFALTATFALCVGDYAKVLMIREDERNAFRAFGRAGRLVIRNIGRTYGLYCLLILIGTGLFGVYFLIDDLILMRNWPTILLIFSIQQALIFARVFLKFWSLGTACNVYETLPKPILIPLPVTLPESVNTEPSATDPGMYGPHPID